MDERSKRNAYAGFTADRADKKRPMATAGEPHSRFILIAGERILLRLTGGQHFDVMFDRADAQSLSAAFTAPVFLGEEHGVSVYALPCEQPDSDTHPLIKAIDMRSIATQGLLPDNLLALAGTGKSLTNWNARNGFCAMCGNAMQGRDAGWRRECSDCRNQQFPRVDPVVIMLAVDGNRALLARSPGFIPGMYSALAGFIEPGETMEDAVRRELHEEAGIRTGIVRYHSSQPWPFPSTLMIGCFARADTIDLDIDTDELEAADWFSRDQIANMLAHRADNSLFAPPPAAIAHQLMKSFVDEEPLLDP